MPDKFGQAFALTVLSPILGGHTHGAVHAAEIRAALAPLHHGGRSPFAAINSLHLARFVVLDDLRQQGIPAKEDHLRSKYLVFVADFDGDFATFIESFRRNAPDLVTAVWQHCVGFPGVADPAAFLEYFRRCHITTTFAFGAYATTPLPRVLRALDSQRRLVRFLESTQDASPEQRHSAFRAFAAELAAAPLPQSGTI